MRRPRLLVVDDDAFFCDLVSQHLDLEVDVQTAHSHADARMSIAAAPPDLLVVDQRLPDGPGLELIGELRRVHENAVAIVVTGFPSVDSAVRAIRDGVHDYLEKPFDLADLRRSVANALRHVKLERVEQVAHYRRAVDEADLALVGDSPAWRQALALAEQAAASDAPVLITGESGTGKNVLARSIHYRGSRRAEPFLSINCGALPESLAEAELFGVERGAYTGANATRKGLFELADGGTLLLDEIGELSVASQAKLLGALEDGCVRRLGSSRQHRIDVRLLAATNVAPAAALAQRSLRRDLYYRLAVLHIQVPPLAARLEDLPALCQHLLQKLAPGRGARLAPGEMEALAAYPWPGNVRELRNVLERALLVERGQVLHDVLHDVLRPAAALAPVSPANDDAATAAGGVPPGMARHCLAASSVAPAVRPQTLAVVEAEHILRVFAANGHNLTRTAGQLGISLSTLRLKLRGLGVPPGTIRREPASSDARSPDSGESVEEVRR